MPPLPKVLRNCRSCYKAATISKNGHKWGGGKTLNVIFRRTDYRKKLTLDYKFSRWEVDKNRIILENDFFFIQASN